MERCAYCHDDLDVAPAPCAGCGTLLHDDCRAEHGECPTLGCCGERPSFAWLGWLVAVTLGVPTLVAVWSTASAAAAPTVCDVRRLPPEPVDPSTPEHASVLLREATALMDDPHRHGTYLRRVYYGGMFTQFGPGEHHLDRLTGLLARMNPRQVTVTAQETRVWTASSSSTSFVVFAFVPSGMSSSAAICVAPGVWRLLNPPPPVPEDPLLGPWLPRIGLPVETHDGPVLRSPSVTAR